MNIFYVDDDVIAAPSREITFLPVYVADTSTRMGSFERGGGKFKFFIQ